MPIRQLFILLIALKRHHHFYTVGRKSERYSLSDLSSKAIVCKHVFFDLGLYNKFNRTLNILPKPPQLMSHDNKPVFANADLLRHRKLAFGCKIIYDRK